jgi:heat shock protein HslJ
LKLDEERLLMKYIKLVILLNFSFCIESSAQVKAGTIVLAKEVPGKDSIEFYDTDYATRQKSYMNLLVGTWAITSMKKQTGIDANQVTDITFTLNRDSSFTGQASCNKIWGKFSIKGTSIKFNDIASTKRTCNKQEEENLFLQLMQDAVSNYTVTRPKLLLRDVSSNVVFEAVRVTTK